MNINTKEYWDARFSQGDWEKKGGFDQTRSFALEQSELMAQYIRPGYKILDFGCGAGDASEIFQAKFPECEYFGQDISEDAISIATARFGALGKFATNFDSSLKFDVIFASNVLEHVDDYHKICELLLPSCKTLFIFVPYKERPLSKEHVRTFNEASFNNYKLLDTKVYLSKGWSYLGVSYWWNVIAKNLVRPLLGKPIVYQNRQIMFALKGAVGD